MSMAVVTDSDHKYWTAADLREIPDDRNRYEIIDGELLVSPSPSFDHQELVIELTGRLRVYLAAHALGTVVVSPADVELADDTVVEPDVFVVPLVAGRRARSWEEAGRLLLAVEVLSPSTARVDRTIKRHRYQRADVPEYWVVDCDARMIERWRPDDERPEILTERLEWHPDAEFSPLIIDLPSFFAGALGG